MGSCGVMMTMIWSVVMGQVGATNIFSYADGLHTEPGVWGTRGYTSALSRAETSSAGVFGEKLYGTELARMELGFRGRVKSQVFQLDLSRLGTSFLSLNRASLSTGIKLGESLELGIRIGYQYAVASGYAAASFPFAGVGFGLQLSEKCRWLVQADDLNAFITDREGIVYQVRTGLSIQLSPICMIALESMVTQPERPSFLASIHYHVTNDIFTRIGFVTGITQFNVAAGFNKKAMQVEFYSAWQVSLGLSAGLSVSCSLTSGKR